MDAHLAAKAIIAHRPGEPFVLIERAPADISDLSDLDWQADTAPPTWTDVQTWAAEIAAGEQAAAMVELRMIRDRWLDQAQIIFARVDGANIGTLPAQIASDIAANEAAWAAWRQAMRDLPAKATDALAAVTAIRDVHSTTDVWPAPWPQPPAAPVKHLT